MFVIITKNNKYVNSIERERERERQRQREGERDRETDRERQVFSGAISGKSQ